MRKIGIMTWEEMDWMFPDFEETGLIYHYTRVENLASIFQTGLISRYTKGDDYQTIYEAHYCHRPDHIPDWVNPRRCIFGYMNQKRGPTTAMGIRAEKRIVERTWTALSLFSDWVYGPKEAGYFDTEELSEYYHKVVEPVFSEAYWKLSMSFWKNLRIRHDRLLYNQKYFELLICLEKIEPDLLSLQSLGVEGPDGKIPALRAECPALFEAVEEKFRRGGDAADELRAIREYAIKDTE